MAGLYRLICGLLLSSIAAGQVSPPGLLVPYPLCTDIPVTFTVSTDTSMDVRSFSWSATPASASLAANGGSTATFFFATPGIHQIGVTVEFGAAPSFTTFTSSVLISRSARAAFNASLSTAGYPNELFLTNYSTNSVRSYWLFNNSAAPDSSINVVRYYGSPGPYTVTLISEGRNGCHNISSYEFIIPDVSSITLPNIFSPNNDGINDIYRPVATGVSALNARILNRNGVIMAAWEKVNGFWDGRTSSGEECDEGVYFIVVEATGFDGQAYTKKGTVTLVR